MAKIQTEQELLDKLEILGIEDESTRNDVVCALLGHSKIQTFCFGYYNCARCGAQVGDSLGSVYSGAEDAVIVGHDCAQCHSNYEGLGWQDKIFCRDPFAVSKEE